MLQFPRQLKAPNRVKPLLRSAAACEASKAADPGHTAIDRRVAAVRDLMVHLERSHRLLVLTCWPPNLRYKLWQTITSELASATSIQFGAVEARHLPWHDRNQHQVVVLVDLACPHTDHLLQSAAHLLYYRVRWIVLHSNTTSAMGFPQGWKNCTEYAFLDRLPLLYSNELFYFCTDPATARHLVRQQYRLSATSPTDSIIETLGSWEATRGVVLSAGEGEPEGRRFNSLIYCFVNSLIPSISDKHIDTISRVNYQLTKSIAMALNATVRFTFVDSWGYRDPETDRYNGMIGELQSDLADLGGTALFFTSDRITVIDYLSMTTPTVVNFVFRAPKLSFTDNVFVLPFQKSVWYCTISFIILAGVLLTVVLRTEQRYAIGSGSENAGPRARLSDALLNVFGTTCQQGSFIEPKTTSSRCLILLCLVVLMFLYASYSANIVALIQSPSTKIQTLDDLLTSRLKAGAEDTVYNRYYFQHQTEPIRKALYERKIRNKDGTENFLPLAQGVEAIRQGYYAFHVEVGVCYKLISETFQEEEKCGLQELEYLKMIDPYYAVRKNSSFREPVRVTLFKLREFGIQGRENALLYTKKPRCIGGSSFVPVSIVDVWPALVTLGWGYLLTISLLIFELLWVRLRGKLLPTDAYFQQ
uniref:Ionotropic glutamate receptor C-terminal domain-containing protein n=1 Tax=Anopheles atroparvus TaxID=41427 RepID=A0AAG5D5B7_ANOAO